MITKTFEIRDRATFIPMIAIKLKPGCEADRYLLSCAGFGTTPEAQAEYVYLIRINGGEGRATCDPYDWGTTPRTVHVAHQHIIKHFDELDSGAVIDVEFILGESKKEKISESVEVPT